ncbi:MAG: acyltransferase, partial [Hyphomicrobiaceae bacterium]|nr:acyltransferase [Hyphomicrobiaceae bacterium]
MPAHHIALDSWRGLAAVLVALHHFVSTGTLTGNALVQNSWIFVDFFFLLSGFIIAANYKSNINSGGDLKNFMLLRLGRLWPLHIVMLALWFLFELAIAFLAKGATTGGRAAFTEPYDLTSLAANIFLVQSLGLNEETRNWVAWSISTEVWTYLVFGVL